MGIFCIILGSVIAVGMVVFGGWVGNLLVTTPYLLNASMKLYQGLGLPGESQTYILTIVAGVLLALMLGLPLIMCGIALNKSKAALESAWATNRKLKKLMD